MGHWEPQAPLSDMLIPYTQKHLESSNPNCPKNLKISTVLNTEASLRQSRGYEDSSDATLEMRGWGQGPRRYLNNKKSPPKNTKIQFPPLPGGCVGAYHRGPVPATLGQTRSRLSKPTGCGRRTRRAGVPLLDNLTPPGPTCPTWPQGGWRTKGR